MNIIRCNDGQKKEKNIICRPCLNKLENDILEFETGNRDFEFNKKCENKEYIESCYFSFVYYFLNNKYIIPTKNKIEKMKKIYNDDIKVQ